LASRAGIISAPARISSPQTISLRQAYSIAKEGVMNYANNFKVIFTGDRHAANRRAYLLTPDGAIVALNEGETAAWPRQAQTPVIKADFGGRKTGRLKLEPPELIEALLRAA
jgi:hypothetical protein